MLRLFTVLLGVATMKKEKSITAIYLAELRGAMGLTQKDLDALASLPINTVAGLESMNKPFTDVRLESLAKALNVSVRDLQMGGRPVKGFDQNEVERMLAGVSESEWLEVRLILRKWREGALSV